MTEVTIRCRPNGPFVIEGSVRIVDHHGNAFAVNSNKPLVALCRCGHSATKPFCDGSHRQCDFKADEVAPTI